MAAGQLISMTCLGAEQLLDPKNLYSKEADSELLALDRTSLRLGELVRPTR
jgi:hypothetical protein